MVYIRFGYKSNKLPTNYSHPCGWGVLIYIRIYVSPPFAWEHPPVAAAAATALSRGKKKMKRSRAELKAKE